MPLQFGVILGEIVHDLRSALDHLVYQMVLLNEGKPYTRNYFPIYLVHDAPNNPRTWVTKAASDLQGVLEQHWALFDRLQPYRRGHRAQFHPLAVLNHLSLVDKHRVLYVAAMNTPYGVLPQVHLNTQGFSGFRPILRLTAGLIQENAEAFRFGIIDAPYGTPRRVDMRVQPPVQVLFSDRALRIYNLERIRLFIARSVFRRFAPLFGETVPDQLLQHPQKPSEFVVLRRGEMGFQPAAPEETPAEFGEWRVWFDAGNFPTPTWYFTGPHPSVQPPDQMRWELPAGAGRTTEEFGTTLQEFLPGEVLEKVFEHFAPEARQTPLGFGVFPT